MKFKIAMNEEIEIEAIEDTELPEIEENKSRKKTSIWMTKYEYTQLIGYRALQITCGDTPRIDTKGMMEPLDIAIQELHQIVIPLSVKRTLLNGKVEVFNVNEMNIRNH